MSSRILRLRGLPWSASEADIRGFLGEPLPQEIFLWRRGDKSTGEAFVEFGTVEEATESQSAHNNESFGDRYIEIFTTDADSLQALKEEVQEQDTGWVVRLRGLPFAATAEDVLAFFNGLEILRGTAGVVLTWGRDGRPLGEAYVEFPSEEVQEEALKRDKEKMGPRYVEIFKSNKADMVMHQRAALSWHKRYSETGQQAPVKGDRIRGRRMSEPGGFAQMLPAHPYPVPEAYAQGLGGSAAVLRLKGLPSDVTAAEVASFFGDFQVLPEAVELLPPDSSGQSAGVGLANVRFATRAAAESARRRQHGRKLRSHIIECFPVTPPLTVQPFPGPTPVYPAPPNMYMPQALSPLAFMLDARGIPRGPAGPLPGYPPEGPTAQTRFFNVRNQNWRPQAGSMQVQAQAPEQPHFQAMGSAQPYQLEAGHEWSPSASSSSRLQAENPLSRGVWASHPRMQPQAQLPTGIPLFPPGVYQQQMLMQQYIMQQHYLQQQAMSQMSPANWGMLPGQGMSPMTLRYSGPYPPGSPMRGARRYGPAAAQPPPQSSRPRSRAARSLVMPEDIQSVTAGTLPLETPALESLSIASPPQETTMELEPDLPSTQSFPTS